MGQANVVHQRQDYKKNYLQNPYNDPHHDPYFIRQKYKNGTYCKSCNALFERGSFRWKTDFSMTGRTVECPACKRIRDGVIGGVVTLTGGFVNQHEFEIRHIIQNVADNEKLLYPLERIIEISKAKNGLVVTTTYEHLARRLGEAINRAFNGKLKIRYGEDEKFVRVNWQRV